MRSSSFWNRVTLFVLTLATVSIFSVFLWISKGFIWNNLYSTISNILVLGSLAAVFYHRRGKLYLLVTRYWAIISNQTATWNCSARFDGSFNELILKSIKQSLLNTDLVKVIKDVDRYMEIFINGMLVECTYANVENDEEEIEGSLTIHIRDFQSAYDKTSQVFNEIILPLFEQVKNDAGSKIKERYYFAVLFGNHVNPFITATLHHPNKKDILSFQCDFKVEEKLVQSPTFVNISKSMLSVTTSSLRRFHELSLNYFGVMGE